MDAVVVLLQYLNVTMKCHLAQYSIDLWYRRIDRERWWPTFCITATWSFYRKTTQNISSNWFHMFFYYLVVMLLKNYLFLLNMSIPSVCGFIDKRHLLQTNEYTVMRSYFPGKGTCYDQAETRQTKTSLGFW